MALKGASLWCPTRELRFSFDVLMNLAVHEAFVLLAAPKEQNNLGFRNIG